MSGHHRDRIGRPAAITGVGHYLPEQQLTNADLCRTLDTSDEWIRERTGIGSRFVAAPGQSTSDLILPAARMALAHAGLTGEDLDLIIVATSTPDMLMPSTASRVQLGLGARKAAAFDMEVACTGFIYGLIVAQQFIAAGTFRRILVAGAEVLSRFLDWGDRGTAILFGDGAGVAIVEASDEPGILSGYLGSDGAGGDMIEIPVGSRATPEDSPTVRMKGREVFKFAVEIVPRCIHEALDRAGVAVDDIRYFILHQANLRIMDAAAKRLGVPGERMLVNIDRVANTSAATIPIALSEAVHGGRIAPGDLLCLVGFGSGLSWGSSVVRWLPVGARSPEDGQKEETR